VRIAHLSLAGFRTYRQLEVEFPGGSSHRTSTDAELIAWGSDFARVEASVVRTDRIGAGADRSDVVEVVLAAPGQGPGSRKRVRVNGVPRRPSALGQVLRAVVFAPEDMLLVVGSPSLRRSVMDTLITQRVAAATSSLATYGRALTQRNNLLRRIREGIAGPDELQFWDDVVCTEGGRIVCWRHEALATLAGPLAAAHAEIAPQEGILGLRYVSNAEPHPGETPEQALRRRLDETSEKELWNGTTLVGPHRDDILFGLDGRELAGFASRGQQRTAILALKLAQLDLLANLDGVAPLLLLDDVFSELDPERRAHLVRRIGGLAQAFVTTTTLADLDPALVAASTAWHVEDGRLEPAAVRP
jgi:DNA replication and repair protein RecF